MVSVFILPGSSRRSRGMSISLAAHQALKHFRDKKASKRDQEQYEADFSTVHRHKPEGLDQLCSKTKFTRKELQVMYRGFKQECPSGLLDLSTFRSIYSQYFPFATSTQYATLIFNTIDREGNEKITFEQYVSCLSTLSRGSVREKLQWAFRLYDAHNDEILTRDELFDIVTAIYDLTDRSRNAPITPYTLRCHVDYVFNKLDRDCDGVVSMEDFIESCTQDVNVMNSMMYLDTQLF